ncbi:NAD-dependent epimerase/dehydratase family protein [Propionibacteriaceae bacterium Y2011]|uniref:NAD-dependent epimerase/dehydratase family protein n=1 Tax=Microlunatus sp. Y2014 TaxID=3418488 RepID=UPI003B4AB922
MSPPAAPEGNTPGETGTSGEARRVVLVTGVARALGAHFARAMAADGTTVIGVDLTPPRHDLGAATYLRADIASPAITRLVNKHRVTDVVHLALVSASGSGQSRSSLKEINVLGAMQLFAACQQAPTVRKLVVQSSISVYAASERGPARFTEDLSESHLPISGLGKDAVEVETYARGLARRRPDCVVTTLRLANLMGAGHHSQIAGYLSLPVVPRVLGFDARMQFLHPDDAVRALQLAADVDVPGTYNVAADDVVTLGQAVAMMGRPSIGVLREALPYVMPTARRAGIVSFSRDELDALTYGRVMDVSRFAAASGFRPEHSSRAALAEFVAAARPGPVSAARIDAGLARAGSLIGRFADLTGRSR